MKRMLLQVVGAAFICWLVFQLGYAFAQGTSKQEETIRKKADAKYDQELAEAVKLTADSCFQPVAFLFPAAGSSRSVAVVLMGQVFRPGDTTIVNFQGTEKYVILRMDGAIVHRHENFPECVAQTK